MELFLSILSLLLAYFAGSIPTALLLGRARGIDVRRHGSGNIGATNAMRVLGKGWGLLCLGCDVAKGWLPVYVLSLVYLASMIDWVGLQGWQWLVGLCAVAGHMFSPFVGFRGGKGVATSMGVLLAIAPMPLLISVVVGLFIIWLTGYVSLAALTGAALMPILILLLGLPRPPWLNVGITLLLALAIAWKHRGNVKRLRAGTESRLFDRLDAKAGASGEPPR